MDPKFQPVVYTGLQPTGDLHIGNYIGAIRPLKALIQKHRGFAGIVDYHAMTIPYETQTLQARIRDAVAVMVAAGLDVARCPIYAQSDVPEHAELQWVFSCVASYGRTGRMTQFKDKSSRLEQEEIAVGLFTYPILQAADILLYMGTHVPVGQDQVQHIEFSRDVARRFNKRFGELFPEPKPVLGDTPKILGLDGEAKMSKSIGNTLGITETKENIWNKLRTAKTDERRKRKSDPGDPAICNVFTIHGAFTPEASREEIAGQCRSAGIGCIDCKKILLETMMAELNPIREKYLELSASPGQIEEILKAGADAAGAVAQNTMEQVRELVGLRKIARSRG